MTQARIGLKSRRSPLQLKARWLVCALPPLAFIMFEETPGLSALNGINAAALIVLSPFVVAIGFGLTAAIAALARWIGSKAQMRSRLAFALVMLVIVGLFSVPIYLERDWLLLGIIELASLPAALLLGVRGPPPLGRTTREVIALLTGFLDGTDDRAWDEFESVPIADPFLESIRRRAVPMGPPNADEEGLRLLLAELRSKSSTSTGASQT
jgi:hypothetical protein